MSGVGPLNKVFFIRGVAFQTNFKFLEARSLVALVVTK